MLIKKSEKIWFDEKLLQEKYCFGDNVFLKNIGMSYNSEIYKAKC